jgi:predicted DNA-binding transcriptional regulator AlpA
MLSAHNGAFERHADGWRYAISGEPVPGAADVTLAEVHGFPIVEEHVEVPCSLASAEEHLYWCLRWARLGQTESVSRDGVILVPRDAWGDHSKDVVGMWAPELEDDRLLTLQEVGRMVKLQPQTVENYIFKGLFPPPMVGSGRKGKWSRPVVEQWMRRRVPGRKDPSGGSSSSG